MSEAATSRYTIDGNLRWFAVIYSFASVVLTASLIAAAYFWPTFNPPSTGLSIGLYVGVVYAAGMRYKAKTYSQWTSRDRNWLAAGYAAASILSSLVVMTVAVPFDAGTRDAIALVASDGAVAIAIAIPITLLVLWVAARLSLMMLARQGGRFK